jgi:hypothetical protein
VGSAVTIIIKEGAVAHSLCALEGEACQLAQFESRSMMPANTACHLEEFGRKGKQMRSYQRWATTLALGCLTSAGPALAQNPSTTPAAPAQVPTPPADNPSFLDGLRRVGVMAGQVVECSADADKQDQISRAMELANQIAIHFGLKAAFTFAGALGYGSGRPFDKAGCSQAMEGWKQIQAKYLNK